MVEGISGNADAKRKALEAVINPDNSKPPRGDCFWKGHKTQKSLLKSLLQNQKHSCESVTKCPDERENLKRQSRLFLLQSGRARTLAYIDQQSIPLPAAMFWQKMT